MAVEMIISVESELGFVITYMHFCLSHTRQAKIPVLQIVENEPPRLIQAAYHLTLCLLI